MWPHLFINNSLNLQDSSKIYLCPWTLHNYTPMTINKLALILHLSMSIQNCSCMQHSFGIVVLFNNFYWSMHLFMSNYVVFNCSFFNCSSYLVEIHDKIFLKQNTDQYLNSSIVHIEILFGSPLWLHWWKGLLEIYVTVSFKSLSTVILISILRNSRLFTWTSS